MMADYTGGTLYHSDPEQCDFTEREHRFRPWSGLCDGHTIAPLPARCRCETGTPDHCPQPVTDVDDAPYCTDCQTARVYGLDGRNCPHDAAAL